MKSDFFSVKFYSIIIVVVILVTIMQRLFSHKINIGKNDIFVSETNSDTLILERDENYFAIYRKDEIISGKITIHKRWEDIFKSEYYIVSIDNNEYNNGFIETHKKIDKNLDKHLKDISYVDVHISMDVKDISGLDSLINYNNSFNAIKTNMNMNINKKIDMYQRGNLYRRRN